MNHIERLTHELCPDGVQYRKLGEVVSVVTAPKKLPRKDYKDTGRFPVIDQGKEPITAYTDDEAALVPDGCYVLFGDHTREVKRVQQRFAQGADGLKILRASDGLNEHFLYHCMKALHIPSRGYNRHWTVVAELAIPVPPLPIQEAIVEILDKFTELEAALEDELEARKLQYSYYRDKLLTFPDGTPRLPLEEVAFYPKAKTSDQEAKYVGVENLKKDRQGIEGYGSVPAGYDAIAFTIDDILIGNIRPYLKKIWQADCDGGTNGDVVLIRIKEGCKADLLPRFLYHVLSSDDFFAYDNAKARGAKMPRGDKNAIMRYAIPLPPLDEQRRIAGILDKFEALTTSLQEGIPAEIEARRQQYRYYRDKLLAFGRKGE